MPLPDARVSTIVASASPDRSSRLRSWSGMTSTPRFLIVREPMPRWRRAAFSRLGDGGGGPGVAPSGRSPSRKKLESDRH
jgi:hypothetical protein